MEVLLSSSARVGVLALCTDGQLTRAVLPRERRGQRVFCIVDTPWLAVTPRIVRRGMFLRSIAEAGAGVPACETRGYKSSNCYRRCACMFVAIVR